MSSIDLLLECHARIRRTAGGLQALADRPEPGNPLVRTTAAACARYLDQALLLHAADEEDSLLPRLDLPAELGAPVARMQQEHHRIHAALPALVAQLQHLARGEAAGDGFPAQARAFAALLLDHIGHEEQALLPWARQALTADQDAAIVAELRARRQAQP